MISSKYITVTKLEKKEAEGFKTVEVQDDFVYKGKVLQLPDVPVYISNRQIFGGDVVIFAKYSPDTHEITDAGVTKKFVSISDLLEVL